MIGGERAAFVHTLLCLYAPYTSIILIFIYSVCMYHTYIRLCNVSLVLVIYSEYEVTHMTARTTKRAIVSVVVTALLYVMIPGRSHDLCAYVAVHTMLSFHNATKEATLVDEKMQLAAGDISQP